MGKRGPQPGAAAKAAAAAKKLKATPAAPVAQGTTTKRTPTSAFDPAAGKDTYEPECIVAQRLAKGITQYQVKWVGWATKDNTFRSLRRTRRYSTHSLLHSTQTNCSLTAYNPPVFFNTTHMGIFLHYDCLCGHGGGDL